MWSLAAFFVCVWWRPGGMRYEVREGEGERSGEAGGRFVGLG
jgi:hypothetical protein